MHPTDTNDPDDPSAESGDLRDVTADALPTVLGVTGVHGLVGRALLRRLDRLGYRGVVVGLDIADDGGDGDPLPPFVRFHRVDVTTPAATDLLAGCDAIVHCAYLLKPSRDPVAEADADLAMFARVVDACMLPGRRLSGDGPTQLVNLSSATVYGAYPNNPVPLGEDAPLRPNEGFVYAGCKAEIERRVVALRDAGQLDDVVVTHLRPASVLGPNCRNYIATMLTSPRPVAVRGERPSMQFVHEDDVAGAIVHALAHRLEGAYNVAAPGWVTPDELDALVGTGDATLRLPDDAFARLNRRLFSLGASPLAPSAVPMVRYPWIVATTKLERTGWCPQFTNEQAVLDTVDAHRRRAEAVARARRARLRPLVALAIVGLLAGFRSARRSRRR